ncbi:MAG TPA: hypothetical protein GX730_03590 [Chloroflexi bacterium]|nr:hypothetical protein [Chloroflexota bacterium]
MKKVIVLIVIALTISACVPSTTTINSEVPLEEITVSEEQTTSQPDRNSEAPVIEESTSTLEPISTVEPTNTLEPTSTPVPTDTPVPTATTNPYLYSAGTYLLNNDIQPGIYQGNAGNGIWDTCYWERLSDLSGGFDAIIANDNSVGNFYVELKETDYAFTVRCSVALIDSLPEPEKFSTTLEPGMYIVGRDVQAGIYHGQAGYEIGDSCYWKRVSGVSGEFDEIIANDNSVGNFYVEIKETDFAIDVRCSLDPIESIPAPEEFLTTLEPGIYIVGRDIQAGTYKGQAGEDIGDSCYWERVSGVSGDFEEIIANDNAVGQFYIEVAPSDFALSVNCPVEFVSD